MLHTIGLFFLRGSEAPCRKAVCAASTAGASDDEYTCHSRLYTFDSTLYIGGFTFG